MNPEMCECGHGWDDHFLVWSETQKAPACDKCSCLSMKPRQDLQAMGRKVTDLIMAGHRFPCSVCGELLVWSEGFFKCPECDNRGSA